MRALSYLSATVLLLAGSIFIAGCGKADVTISKQDAGRLGEVTILTPKNATDEFPVVLLVPQTSSEALAAAGHIASVGHSVVMIDWSLALAATAAKPEPCHYLIGDLEQLIQRYQTTRSYPRYVPPVVIGFGEGGDIAYALLAQAPPLAIAGAIGIGRTGKLKSNAPFCNEAAEVTVNAETQSYGPKPDTSGWWRSVISPAETTEAAFAKASSGGADQANTVLVAASASDSEKLDAALSAARAIVAQNAETPLTDLPLTPLKSALPGDVLAIIISGDGGWRDLDQQIGFELAKGNISVVGVDSLHYFWQAKSPQSIADDLTRIADHFSALWKTKHLLLIGYSFGADIMPAAIAHMTPAMRARIDQISLLGMSDTADYEIHVAGWVGIQPKGEPVAPDARKLDMSRVQCFYGTEEEISFCRSPIMQAAERFGIAGGHHFDGNYPHLAALIEAGLSKQLAAASAGPAVSHPEQ